ncbi:hypothetical protein I549_5125 [Mycobacterium avium subsp. avium 2285 (R)]|nr:hypothetical protein I549_5125 [Mycobacterium avium subsp. avium 2285 (R)]
MFLGNFSITSWYRTRLLIDAQIAVPVVAVSAHRYAWVIA